MLTFEPEALKAIAHEAVEHGTGARGLRSICERVLQDVMYDLPEQKGPSTVTIRATDITGETKPDIEPTDGAEALPAAMRQACRARSADAGYGKRAGGSRRAARPLFGLRDFEDERADHGR